MTLCELLKIDPDSIHISLSLSVKIGFFWMHLGSLTDMVSSADGNTLILSPGGINASGKASFIAGQAKLELPDLSKVKVTVTLGPENWSGTAILKVTIEGAGVLLDGDTKFGTEDFKEFSRHADETDFSIEKDIVTIQGWKLKFAKA